MISRVINLRYEVLERVGEGALFQVFKARDKVMNRMVAVKTLQPLPARDPAFCHALRDAVTPLQALTHPGIARVLEIGEEEGAPYLVTEFVRGIHLKERIRRIAPFTLSVAVDFAIAITEAVQHAHTEGMVHGDLRPQHVIVSPEGTVKVVDFGLTGAIAASADVAAAAYDNSAPYLTPEGAAGAPPSVSGDLYAVGAILFEMLTGSTPYPVESAAAAAQRRLNDPVPSPRTSNPGVPRSLEGIVMKSLQRRPEERYRSAADLLNDLKQVRDALRFGKPLSWSPLEAEPLLPVADVPRRGEDRRGVRPEERDRYDERTRVDDRRSRYDDRRTRYDDTATTVGPARGAAPAEPEEEAPVGAARMSATGAGDDRISPFLKIALGTVIVIIITAVIAGIAVWMATITKIDEKKFPSLVGMKIEDARSAAAAVPVRLMEHEEFNEKTSPGVIYRSDWDAGRPVRAGRTINVWVSKGSRMVWVPDVTNMPSADAEKKLKDAGLTLGQAAPENNAKVPAGYIIAQNPRAGKRVQRDFPVNVTLSEGPKPEDLGPPPNESPTPPTGDAPGAGTAPDAGANPDGNQDMTARNYTVSIAIRRDGLGNRRVRVEYDDSLGTHTPIDEYHDEGDVISQKVGVVGSKITLRVYYGDDATPVTVRSEKVGGKRE